METFVRDVRHALRSALREPGHSLVVVLSLALGVGATTTMFTLVNSAFLSPLPVADGDRLVAVLGVDPGYSGYVPHSYPNFEDLKAAGGTLDGMLAVRWEGFALVDGDRPTRVFGQYVSVDYFDVLGVEMAEGRGFAAGEDQGPGSGPVVVLSHGLWQRRFGRDPSIVGRDVEINDRKLTVVGIGPPGFQGTDKITACDLWVPMSMFEPMSSLGAHLGEREWRIFEVFGRLAPGTSLAQASASLKAAMAGLRQAHPLANEGADLRVVPLAHNALGGVDDRERYVQGASLLMLAVGLILLIACGNVASLLAIRAVARRREIAIRVAGGASRLRLVRLVLTESVVLALAGGLAGLGLTLLVRGPLWRLKPVFIDDLSALAMDVDLRVFGFALGVSVLVGLLFGVAPAIHAWRSDLRHAIQEREPGGARANRWYGLRNLLVAFQVALAVITLVGAGLLLETFENFKAIDAGYDYDRLVSISFHPGAQGYDPPRRWGYYQQVMDEAREVPGVVAAAISSQRPLERAGILRSVRAEGDERPADEAGLAARADAVSEGFFEAMGIAIVQGRGVRATDGPGVRPVAVVNQTMAARLWPGRDPLGRLFSIEGVPQPVEVVGVAADAKYVEIGEAPSLYFYRPLAQVPIPNGVLFARVEGDPRAAVEPIRRAIQALDPRMPLIEPIAVVDRFHAKQWAPRLGAVLMSSFGALALFMMVLGIYGAMSYSVKRRRREIGIRMAIGGRRATILHLFLQQALTVAAVGCVAGLAAAWFGGRLVESVLYGLAARDLGVFAASTAWLVLAAMAAAFLPAWVATRVHPSRVLREE